MTEETKMPMTLAQRNEQVGIIRRALDCGGNVNDAIHALETLCIDDNTYRRIWVTKEEARFALDHFNNGQIETETIRKLLEAAAK